MKTTLINLAKQILCSVNTGLPKVKFAKIIYLTHKWMIKNNMATISDIKYIRMPLGPVPINFENIPDVKGISVKMDNLGLSYNRELYYTTITSSPNDKLYSLINVLASKPTSQLVDYAHKENSWMERVNGEEYFIDKRDLKRSLPFEKMKLTKSSDNAKLQAKLIEGMINEIVDESTSLEYPKTEN